MLLKIIFNFKKKTKFNWNRWWKKIVNKNFTDLSNENNVKSHSHYTSLGAVSAERFNRTIRDLLKNQFFEKGDVNWIDILPTITKQHNNRVHTCTKLTPIQASLRKNEEFAYKKLLDKWKKIKPKFQVNDLLRTTDLKRTFSKGDTTDWSYKWYKTTEIIIDTIPNYLIEKLIERFIEALLKKKVINEKTWCCLEKIKFKFNQNAFVYHCL